MQAYLERDVRWIINLESERKFFHSMPSAAARFGQLFNASDIANSIDVDYKTVQSWVSILRASGVVRLLQPFWPDIGKSLTKTPKLYFMDTGLVCHLTCWTTPDQLRNGAVMGHVFETFVVSEVLKSYMNACVSLRDVVVLSGPKEARDRPSDSRGARAVPRGGKDHRRGEDRRKEGVSRTTASFELSSGGRTSNKLVIRG